MKVLVACEESQGQDRRRNQGLLQQVVAKN